MSFCTLRRIEVENVTDNYGKCTELLRGRELPFTKDSDGYSIVAEVPAYDVGIFRWE
jgi:hypothetical protein